MQTKHGRDHCTPNGVADAKAQTTPNSVSYAGSNRNSHSLLVERQNRTDTLKDSLAASYKANMVSPYDLAITLQGVYPNELKIYVHKKSGIQMFMDALFVTAKIWK